jgi:hypothetical protein
LRQEGLDEALEAQVLHGGRIGTNLVELGHVTEEQLARALGAQFRVVCAFGEIVPSTEALALVDPNFCDDKDVLPARVDGHKLYLLVLDPDDIEARDQVAVSTGLRVMPVVICEFRMRSSCAATARPSAGARGGPRRHPQEARRRQGRREAQARRSRPDSEDEFASIYADAMSGRSAAADQGELEEGLIVEDVIVGELLPPDLARATAAAVAASAAVAAAAVAAASAFAAGPAPRPARAAGEPDNAGTSSCSGGSRSR